MGIRKTAILLAAVMLSAYAPAWAAEAYDTRIEQAFVNMPEIEAVVYAADGAEKDVSAASLRQRCLRITISYWTYPAP